MSHSAAQASFLSPSVFIHSFSHSFNNYFPEHLLCSRQFLRVQKGIRRTPFPKELRIECGSRCRCHHIDAKCCDKGGMETVGARGGTWPNLGPTWEVFLEEAEPCSE